MNFITQTLTSLMRKIKLTAFSITLIYITFSAGWILISGYLLDTFVKDHVVEAQIELLKGIFFVIITGGLLYFLLRNWQNRLHSSNNILANIIDTAPVRIFWKDKDLNFLGCNRAFAHDAGVDTPAEVIGKSDYEMGWKDQAELYRADDRHIIDTGTSKLCFEEPQTTPNGKTMWLSTSKVPLRDEENEIVGILGIYRDISKRKRIEQALIEEKNAAQNYLNIVNVMILILDADKNVQLINRRGCEIMGYSADEMIGKNWMEHFIPERFRKTVNELGDSVIQPSKPIIPYFENPVVSKSGEERLIAWHNTALTDQEGNIIGILTSGEDITDRKKNENELIKLSQALQQSPNAIIITDYKANIEYVNTAFINTTGYTQTEVIGKNPRFLKSGKTPQGTYEEMWKHITNGEAWYGELINRHKNGTEYSYSINVSPVFDTANKITHYIAIQEDITDKKQAEEHIRYLANFDPLTGLPNRRQLNDHFDYTLSLAKRHGGNFTLIFLDLDRFKEINDSLGHTFGDTLLIELAKRLKLAMREEDTISRMGGDEFILLLPDVDAQEAAQIALKLQENIAKPFVIDGQEMTVTASIGIALYPTDGSDMETLSQNADAAMYRAKQEGRNTFFFFTEEMQTISKRNLRLSNSLYYALSRNEIHLVYQPQISIETGRIIGAEALIRWHHPELGMVSPAEFIPIAENNGLILPIGEWVLRTAASQLRTWIDNGLPPFIMAVNLSAVQFRHPNLPEIVTQILTETSLPPEYLELELTEGVAMNNPQGAISIMNHLHECGIRMSIDDFGTGYSSLSYLKQFKVYKLKIDQSFVRDISVDPEDKAIVSAIINMAHSLGLKTIAEGVETVEQLNYLREQGCNEVQGYYYSKPLPAEQFEIFLAERNK